MNNDLEKILIILLFGCLVFGCQEKHRDVAWVKLPSPISAQIRCFAESTDGTYYVGTSELYKSTDQGKSWELMDFDGMPEEIMVTHNGSILVGTYRGGIFKSTDKGNTWKSIGFKDNVYIFNIIQTEEGKIFASATFISEGASKDAKAGVFISEDDGDTWEQTSITAENIKGVFNPKPNLVFASGTGEFNFHRSTDNGVSWSDNVKGLPDSIPVSAVVELKDVLFASVGDPQDAARRTGGGIYKSTDDGLTWDKSDNGLSENTKVSDLTFIENTLYVSTGYQIKIGDRGVFKSEDLGETWHPAGLNELQLRLIRATKSQQLVAGSNVLSIFISPDRGESWQQTGKEIENWNVFQVIENKSYLITSGESGIWRAKLPVSQWEQINDGLGGLVKLSNGNILLAENGVISKSTDNGRTWESISDLKTEMIFLYAVDDNLLIACAQRDGIYYSNNNGADWIKYDVGPFDNSRFRTAIKLSSGTLLVGTTNGTLRSIDHGKTWDKVDEESYVWSFLEIDNSIYAGGYAQGVRRSTDDGLTWREFNGGLKGEDSYLTVTSLCKTSDGSIICGTLGEGIYKLGINDSIWSEYSTGLEDLVNFGIIEGNAEVLYTTSGKGIYKRNY
ncbi:hypothetical protein [Robiginitalea sp. SC105]|uniref:hypothetical protein n=1 Tax=Robiginitalea sp. SC105 TaxID=2762332 RepID=UPI00163A9BC3|nr:hypothetical protein [Robiginitalea sp. SC105]MBC2838624.1 hypothetical protein [Robiginitalea sp. SC105]